jgi:peptidoglycan hydrolase-like protein with peptidoglycan-binding domain
MRRQREKVEEKTYSLHTMTKRNSIIIGLCVAILATSAVLFTPRASAQVTGSINSQLEIGMSGPAVTQLQTFLAMDSSIYPEGLVTGYFGSLTRAAVLRFQARYGIDQVGRVGPQTLARINAFIASGGFGGVGGVGIRVAPTIGNVMIDTNTSNQLTVSWTTDVATQGTVYYSASPLTMVEASANTSVVIGGTAVSDGDGMTANHSATITGLTSGTTQYILICAVDAQGDESVTTVSTVSVR